MPTFCFRQMYKQNTALVDMLKPVITGMGYEMWGIEYLPGKNTSLLRIYIDNESGITLADCERVSDQVAGILDVNNPVRGSYQLEVSSPGIDRLLFDLEQVERYTGFQVKLKLKTKLNERRNITGLIKQVAEDSVFIVEGEETYKVPAEIIEKARLIQ